MSSQKPNLLIVIPTTNEYKGNDSSPNRNEPARRKACLETWLSNCPCDYKLFCDDTPYSELSNKMVRMTQWALNHNYTHLLRVDTDAYVYVERLLRSGFENHDYVGYTVDYPEHIAWARYASGAGFTLSQRAMEIVANNIPDHPADDLWTGRILFKHGIRCYRDTRYLCGFEPHFVNLSKLPLVHPYMVLHALKPHELRAVHQRPHPGDDITPPLKPMFEPHYDFCYGQRSDKCKCEYCEVRCPTHE